MLVNKRQELYFASVVFILLTMHYFGNSMSNFDSASDLEEDCDDWASICEQLIEEFRNNGYSNLIIAASMAGLAYFFWPQLTVEEKQKREKIRQDLEEKIAAKNAEREKNRIELRGKRKETEKVRFKEAYISGDLSKIGPREIVAYRKYATWADENKELKGQKEDYILGLNENSDESE